MRAVPRPRPVAPRIVDRLGHISLPIESLNAADDVIAARTIRRPINLQVTSARFDDAIKLVLGIPIGVVTSYLVRECRDLAIWIDKFKGPRNQFTRSLCVGLEEDFAAISQEDRRVDMSIWCRP